MLHDFWTQALKLQYCYRHHGGAYNVLTLYGWYVIDSLCVNDVVGLYITDVNLLDGTYVHLFTQAVVFLQRQLMGDKQ